MMIILITIMIVMMILILISNTRSLRNGVLAKPAKRKVGDIIERAWCHNNSLLM